jgi:hypothetical protein
LSGDNAFYPVKIGDAITAAGKLGFMHHQAVGNELAGVYFLEQRKDRT